VTGFGYPVVHKGMRVSAASCRPRIRVNDLDFALAPSRRWAQNWGLSDDTSPPARFVTNRRTAHPSIRGSRFRPGTDSMLAIGSRSAGT